MSFIESNKLMLLQNILIFFFLNLVSKYNKRIKKIFYLLYPYNSLINNYIISEISTFFYLFFQNVFIKIVYIKKYAILIKQNIKKIICNIFIVL